MLSNQFILKSPKINHQVIKNVLLVNMYCDERLIFGSLHLGQIVSSHINQFVQKIQEFLVSSLHYLL